jgi:hypothetical protein
MAEMQPRLTGRIETTTCATRLRFGANLSKRGKGEDDDGYIIVTTT